MSGTSNTKTLGGLQIEDRSERPCGECAGIRRAKADAFNFDVDLVLDYHQKAGGIDREAFLNYQLQN